MVLTGQSDTLETPGCIDEQHEAAGFVREAFAEAIIADVDTRAFAEASIAIGLEELVARYGEDAVVEFATKLVGRLQAGEFTDAVRH